MSANDRGSEHYKRMAIEPWDVIDSWPEEQRIGFYRGNLLKYTLRLGSKDAAISEAKKAQHYAEKLVETLEQQRTNDMVKNMQGNNLSMNICDTMSLADSCLTSAQQEMVSWGRELKPVSVRMQYSLDGVTWTDSEDGSFKAAQSMTIKARIHPDDDLRWGEHHEARIDAIGQNGGDGAHYFVDGRGDDAEVV